MMRGQGVSVSRMQLSTGGDPSGWWESAGYLIGAGTGGVIIRELIGRIFKRADRQDDLAVNLRESMVRRMDALEARNDLLEGRYEELEKRERETFTKFVVLEAENLQLRRRWHAFVNWYGRQTGLPDLPDYLHERIDGPTAATVTPRPPEPETMAHD